MSEERRREGGADMARLRRSIPTAQCVCRSWELAAQPESQQQEQPLTCTWVGRNTELRGAAQQGNLRVASSELPAAREDVACVSCVVMPASSEEVQCLNCGHATNRV